MSRQNEKEVRKKTKREFNIVMSGQFLNLAMFLMIFVSLFLFVFVFLQ